MVIHCLDESDARRDHMEPPKMGDFRWSKPTRTHSREPKIRLSCYRLEGGRVMLRHLLVAAVLLCSYVATSETANADQRAYGQRWGGQTDLRDWSRFYHYPYVYYPQNFWGQDYYKSSDSLYHRYPAEMRIPVYNKKWHNYYPSNRRFHKGHHFMLDVF